MSKNNNNKTSESGLDIVVERREFYKDMFSSQRKIAIFGVVSMVISLGALITSINSRENNSYFAVDQNFNMVKMVALSEPNVKNSAVANWLSRALVDTFDFNYFNIKHHLNEASMKWFTPEGAAELIKALSESGNFDVIVERKLLVNLSVDSVPVIIKEGVIDDRRLWKLQVPATITYRNETSVSSNKVIFTVTVSRVSLLTDPVGLGIVKIIMERAK